MVTQHSIKDQIMAIQTMMSQQQEMLQNLLRCVQEENHLLSVFTPQEAPPAQTTQRPPQIPIVHPPQQIQQVPQMLRIPVPPQIHTADECDRYVLGDKKSYKTSFLYTGPIKIYVPKTFDLARDDIVVNVRTQGVHMLKLEKHATASGCDKYSSTTSEWDSIYLPQKYRSWPQVGITLN